MGQLFSLVYFSCIRALSLFLINYYSLKIIINKNKKTLRDFYNSIRNFVEFQSKYKGKFCLQNYDKYFENPKKTRSVTCPLLSSELTTVVKIKRTLENAHTHKGESS